MWRIELFGGLALRRVDGVSDEIITRFRTRKAAALLARLALEEKPLPREVLADAVWPEASLAMGRNNLRVALASLRRQVEPPGVPFGSVLRADRSTVELDPELVSSDVRDFLHALKSARASSDSSARLRELIAACEMYGPLLPGFYEEWIAERENQLEVLFLEAAEEVVAMARSRGEAALARHWEDCRQRVEDGEQPSAPRPPSSIALPNSLAREDGPKSSPLAEEPSALETSRKSAAKSSKKKRDTAASGAPETWPEMWPEAFESPLPPAWNRFFDRDAEWQSLTSSLREGARLVTVHGVGGCGKTRLALEVAREMRVEASSKSSSDDSSDGSRASSSTWKQGEAFEAVAWVSLAHVDRGEEIADAIATGLKLEAGGERPPLERIVAALGQRRVLLVLDNLEQIVDEAATLVDLLLERARGLSILATSRHRLGLKMERVIPLTALPIPDEPTSPPLASHQVLNAAIDAEGLDFSASEAMRLASVRLFVDRAVQARPDFALTPRNTRDVLALVRRLEGLPLALELAGARAGSLSPRAMREQMDAPLEFLRARRAALPRHDALRTCIAWSYSLLSPERQKFWARGCAFRGGATVDAIAHICFPRAQDEIKVGATHPRRNEALEHLEALRDASMVLYDEESERFLLQESMRLFALEQFSEEERGELFRAHAAYFRARAEAWEQEFDQTGGTRSLPRDEIFNLRALVDRAVEVLPAEPGASQSAKKREALGRVLLEEAWRAVSALTWFWVSHGHVHAAMEMISEMHAASARHGWEPAAPIRAKLEMCAGLVALHGGSTARARGFFEQALEIFDGQGQAHHAATAHNYLGSVALARAEVQGAREHFARSLSLHHEHSGPRPIAIATSCLGQVEVEAGEAQTARAHAEEAAGMWRALEDKGGVAWALAIQAQASILRGEWEGARRLARRALDLRRQQDNAAGEATVLALLGFIADAERDALALDASSNSPGEAERLNRLREEAIEHLIQSARRRLLLGHRRELLPVLEALAGLAASPQVFEDTPGSGPRDSIHDLKRDAQAEAAARALGASQAWRDEMEVHRLPDVQKRWSRARQVVRAALPPGAFEAEWSVGKSLLLEETAHELLATLE
jgi:predicted ATPase